jgi:post-segregation antitoxin (ccd killing protein)
MTRRNISLPDDIDDLARDAGLNVSALARQAILGELDRRSRMQRLDAWLDAMDEEHGTPTRAARDEAEAWVASATPVKVDATEDDATGPPPASKSVARPRRPRVRSSSATDSSPRPRRATG